MGRPFGDCNSKRLQCLKVLNEDKIEQAKAQTLEYYKIQKDEDKYVVLIY